MRSSSVKTLVSAVSLTFTLIVAAPPAEARPSQPKRPSQSAPSMADRAQRVVRQFLKRVFGITGGNGSTVGLPSDPIPTFRTPDDEGLPSDPIPQN
jgi:hypothetical protein